MKKVYIASPFFCEKETEALEKVEKILKARSLNVFSPREHQISKENIEKHEWSELTFKSDKAAIDRCDVVVMLYWGNYSDSGTAWECGYAYGIGVPCVVVQMGEDSNLEGNEGEQNEENEIEGNEGEQNEENEIERNEREQNEINNEEQQLEMKPEDQSAEEHEEQNMENEGDQEEGNEEEQN